MTENIIRFQPRSAQRVPPNYNVVSRAGEVRGVFVEIWRGVDGNSLDIVLSPTSDGFHIVAHLSWDMLGDISTIAAAIVLETLRASEATWFRPENGAA